MSFPKILVILTILIFGSIAVAAFLKKDREEYSAAVEEITLDPIAMEALDEEPEEIEDIKVETAPINYTQRNIIVEEASRLLLKTDEEDVDRIEQLFSTRGEKLPIVQTVIYTSRVPWLKGRAAWIVDYASHYKTSRHFIARSLNGKPDYDNQNVSEGQRFNVLNPDKNIEFYLVIDLLTNKMQFYYIDTDTQERVLLKSYLVGLGRLDSGSKSGSLTPTGKYKLGDKVAAYRPKVKGNHQGEKVEMVRVFGTRWIPLAEEIGECSAPAKGLGLHGLPLELQGNGELVENSNSLGKYESDGCIRLSTKDIEELYSIIISRPTTVEIVRGF